MNITTCPKCGKNTDLSMPSCPSCGIVFSKYYRNRLFNSSSQSLKPVHKIRLVFDIIMGISGLSMILSGLVAVIITFYGKKGSGNLGDMSCLILGAGLFLSGTVISLISGFGIAKSLR